jgi:ribose transport system substrate-binding protein
MAITGLVASACGGGAATASPPAASPTPTAASSIAPSASPTSTAAAPTAPSASPTEDPTAAAAALVQAATGVPAFKGPSEAIDVSSLKGKTVWILVNSMQNTFNAAIGQAAADALGKAGIKTKIVDGQGQPSEWSRQTSEAVAQNAAAIIDSGEATELLSGPLKDVAAAKIPFVEAINDVNAVPATGVGARVVVDFGHSGEIQAAYAIAQSNGTGSVLILGDDEFPTEKRRVEAQVQYFKDHCPACKVTVKNEQLATLATSVPADTQSILRANPDIKWILPAYDYLGGFVVQGLTQGAITGVSVVGADAVSQQLDQIRAGGAYVADAGETPVWCGWAGADEIMRLMLGKSASNEEIPVRLFTKDNLTSASNDPAALFATDFESPLLKLWGLSQ